MSFYPQSASPDAAGRQSPAPTYFSDTPALTHSSTVYTRVATPMPPALQTPGMNLSLPLPAGPGRGARAYIPPPRTGLEGEWNPHPAHAQVAPRQQQVTYAMPMNAPGKVWPCPKCTAVYATWQELQKHALAVLHRAFPCRRCGLLYETVCRRWQHEERCSVAVVWHCTAPSCSVRGNVKAIDAHAAASGHASFTCDFPGCGRSFVKHERLYEHWKTHTEDKKPNRGRGAGAGPRSTRPLI